MIVSIIIVGLLAIATDILCLMSICRMAGYMGNKWAEGYLTRKRCWMVLTLLVIVLCLGPMADYTNHLSNFVRRWMTSTEEYSCPVSYLTRYCVVYTAYGFALSLTCLSMLLWMWLFRRFHAPKSLRLFHALKVALISLLLNTSVLLLCPSEDYFKEAWTQYKNHSIK